MAEKISLDIRSCKNCGDKVKIDTKVCSSCGTKRPGITVKNEITAALFLVTLILLIASFFGKTSEKDESDSASQSPIQKQAQAALATQEELLKTFERSQVRASTIKTLRILVEPMIEFPNQTQVTQDLLNAKTACKNLSHQAFSEEVPLTEKELVDLYRQMNSALSFASSAICQRIDAAIELSSGTKSPVKAAEKFEHAGRWYAYEIENYDRVSQALDAQLKYDNKIERP